MWKDVSSPSPDTLFHQFCFQRLKSTGFKIEKINVEGKSRFKLLMAATFFAYTITIIEGLKTYQKVPIKKYQKKKAKAISVFAHGFTKIKTNNFSFEQFARYINDLFQQVKDNYKSLMNAMTPYLRKPVPANITEKAT